jgi:hypothetical protein
METVAAEIDHAIRGLGLPTEAIRKLAPMDADRVYSAALQHFVSTQNPSWWWESFRQESMSRAFLGDSGWRHLLDLVPDPEEKVWFITEEDASPFYIVYEASPRALRQLLGECYFFEYYLIDQDHEWLLCENHHRMMFAVGREARERLTRFRSQPLGRSALSPLFEPGSPGDKLP